MYEVIVDQRRQWTVLGRVNMMDPDGVLNRMKALAYTGVRIASIDYKVKIWASFTERYDKTISYTHAIYYRL